MVKFIDLVGWYGTVTGILGDIIVTSHLPNNWMFIAMAIWLSSNLAWVFYGWQKKAWHLLTLQIIYTGLSAWGMVCW